MPCDRTAASQLRNFSACGRRRVSHGQPKGQHGAQQGPGNASRHKNSIRVEGWQQYAIKYIVWLILRAKSAKSPGLSLGRVPRIGSSDDQGGLRLSPPSAFEHAGDLLPCPAFVQPIPEALGQAGQYGTGVLDMPLRQRRDQVLDGGIELGGRQRFRDVSVG